MSPEKLNTTTDVRLQELAKNLHTDEGKHYMELELGKTRYPVIAIGMLGRRYRIEAFDKGSDDYVQQREPKDSELLTFIEVARHVDPKSFMTERLIFESLKMLDSQVDMLQIKADSKRDTISTIKHNFMDHELYEVVR